MDKSEPFFKNKEEVVSMFVGLGIVVAIVILLVNLIQGNKGKVDVPGVTDNLSLDQKLTPPTTETNKMEYVVKKGDYLSKIAKEKYGSRAKWVEIAKANDIKNPDNLEIGQKLKLDILDQKEEGQSSSEKTEITEYKVKKGDSLWKICVALYGDGYQWPKLWELNKDKIQNPGLIEIGMMLKLK